MPRNAITAALLVGALGAFAPPALASAADCLPSGRLTLLGVQREPTAEGGLRVSILLQNNQPMAQTYNVTYVGSARETVGNFRRRIGPQSQVFQWVATFRPGAPAVTDQMITGQLHLVCE